MGLIDKTFAIDTIGEYCQCNLIDSSSTVKNPEGIRPKECETCEYKMADECFHCGSEIIDRCVMQIEFMRCLQEFEQLRCLIDSKLQQVNNSCNCNGDCNCEKDKSPVYCVKNYSL